MSPPRGPTGRGTHLIGHFEASELGEGGDSYHIDAYDVDPDTGVVTMFVDPTTRGLLESHTLPLAFRNDHLP